MITVVYRRWYTTGYGEYHSEYVDVSEADPDVDDLWEIGDYHNPCGYRIEYTNGTEYIIPQSQVLAIIDDGVEDES